LCHRTLPKLLAPKQNNILHYSNYCLFAIELLVMILMKEFIVVES
jgi:hypothetical protein